MRLGEALGVALFIATLGPVCARARAEQGFQGLTDSLKSVSQKSESHYFHDFSKSGLSVSGNLSLRVVQRLSWDLHADASRTRNQLSLPKREATTDEILLRQRQLATSYNYGLWIGLSYTFGSIYSSFVNPRFGK
jgi:hypothetical protein